MSLVVTVDDPAFAIEDRDHHFYATAGGESCRTKLWGTPAVAKRAPILTEIANDLCVKPDRYAQFEVECLAMEADAEAVASALGLGADGAERFLLYIRNFLEAVQFARSHNSECIRIW